MFRKTKIKKAAPAKPGIPGLNDLIGLVAILILTAATAAAQNPAQNPAAAKTPAGDEFNAEKLSPPWRWRAGFEDGWAYMFPARGVLRMNSVQTIEKYRNLADAPNLLLRNFPAEEFTATAKITLNPRFEGEKFGLVVLGADYASIGVSYKGGQTYIAQAFARDAERGAAETESVAYRLGEKTFYLRVRVEKGGLCQFGFSPDGAKFTNLGVASTVRKDRENDLQIGLFFTRPAKHNDAGTADVDWFRID